MFEKAVKYLSIISLGVFLLSYAYLNAYYSSFHIDIINYISTPEIFYTMLPLTIIVMSAGSSLLQGAVTRGTFKPKIESELPARRHKIWYERPFVLLSIAIAALAGLFINRYTYRESPAVSCFLSIVFFISLGYGAEKENIKTFGFYPYLQGLSFVLVGYLFIQFGAARATVNKNLGNEEKISLKYNNSIYTTDRKLILVGETQSTIFLYRKADSTTVVLDRKKIDSLIVFAK